MKIFVIPSSYKNVFNTQSNIFVHEQCRELIRRGHSLVVLDATTRSVKQWGHKICSTPVIRYEDDVKVYSYWVRGIAKSRLPQLATYQFKKHIERLWKMAVEQDGMPDVIYAHFTFPSGYCALELSKKYNVPLVTMEHGGMYLNKKIHPYIVNMLKQTVEKSNEFFCVSAVQAECVKKLISSDKDISVIPDMISDIFTYTPLISNESFTIFSAGNLKHVKRFDILISAFCKAFSPDAPVYLRIAGDGELKESLMNQIKANGRENQITLLGRLGREDMLNEYKNCNVFAMASEHESFGVVNREATSCGRPIVSTMNGGVSEGWSDDFGYLVPVNDVDAYSNALNDIYTNYSDFSPETIAQKTSEYCSQEVVMNRIEDILIKSGELNARN